MAILTNIKSGLNKIATQRPWTEDENLLNNQDAVEITSALAKIGWNLGSGKLLLGKWNEMTKGGKRAGIRVDERHY